jgi:hypothetical protein
MLVQFVDGFQFTESIPFLKNPDKHGIFSIELAKFFFAAFGLPQVDPGTNLLPLELQVIVFHSIAPE